MAENEDRFQEDPNRFDRELEERLLRAQQSADVAETVAAEFELPNGVCGVMMGDNQEEVLKRISVLREFYRRCELTSATQSVALPNGRLIANVPVGFTGQDILEVADATLAIRDRLEEFPHYERLQSGAVH